MKTRASNTERAQFKLEFKRGTARSKFPNLEIKATWRELNTIWRSLLIEVKEKLYSFKFLRLF